MNDVLPGVTLVLTNPANQSKYEVHTNSSGRYEFVGLPPGDYLFEAKLPGFMTFKGTLTIAGADVQQDLTMELGTLQETITVATSRSAPSSPTPAPVVATASRPRPARQPCGQAPADEAAGVVRVGGNIRPPMKIRDVRPTYPGYLAAQGVEGTVLLKGRIGTSGLVEALDVVSTPHADLATAATDAVRQWEFTETLLNCRAVPVMIGITVNFTLNP